MYLLQTSRTSYPRNIRSLSNTKTSLQISTLWCMISRITLTRRRVVVYCANGLCRKFRFNPWWTNPVRLLQQILCHTASNYGDLQQERSGWRRWGRSRMFITPLRMIDGLRGSLSRSTVVSCKRWRSWCFSPGNVVRSNQSGVRAQVVH